MDLILDLPDPFWIFQSRNFQEISSQKKKKQNVILIAFLLAIKFSPKSHRLLVIFLISVKKMKVRMHT